MLRGLFTGASGMQTQLHHMDILANNLANTNLTGFKQDISVQKPFGEILLRRFNDDGVHVMPIGSVDTAPVIGVLGLGVELNESFTDFSMGSPRQTENPFDLMIEGRGFFAIETPYGERYTRNGSFTIDQSGQLLTKDGHPVLGENGYIFIKKNNFKVDPEGRIFQNPLFTDDPNRLVGMEENTWEQAELVDTLRVVDFPGDFPRERFLKKVGESMWMATEESLDPDQIDFSSTNKILQGFLEASNVNPVNTMTRMIEINRAYEANQKTMQSQDELAGQLIRRITTM